MLTPKIFRTEKYGFNKMSNLDVFSPQSSRFYCYVMDEYSESNNLMRDLPHRDLGYKEWDTICSNIGWLTFDDVFNFAKKSGTMNEYSENFKNFFKNRDLV